MWYKDGTTPTNCNYSSLSSTWFTNWHLNLTVRRFESVSGVLMLPFLLYKARSTAILSRIKTSLSSHKRSEKKEKKKQCTSVPVACPLIFHEAFCEGVGMKWKHSVQLSSWLHTCSFMRRFLVKNTNSDTSLVESTQLPGKQTIQLYYRKRRPFLLTKVNEVYLCRLISKQFFWYKRRKYLFIKSFFTLLSFSRRYYLINVL